MDYTSLPSLTAALSGQDAVVSTIAGLALETQLLLIDAAIASHVRRFIPSEFGSDLANPKSAALPVFAAKVKVSDYLARQAAAHPDFSYTLLRNSAFLDWGLQVGFIFDVRSAAPQIFDSGNQRFSTTSLATIGAAVAAVLRKPEETKNRAVTVQDLALTQRQILEIATRLDPATERRPVQVSTTELREKSFAELKAGTANEDTFRRFIASSIWGEGYGGEFAKTDNALLGLPEKDLGFVEELVRGILEKK